MFNGLHLTYTYFDPVIRFLPALTVTREQIDSAISVLDEALTTALRGNISLDSLLPSNRYSRSFAERLTGQNALRRFATRLFETSPKYWARKFKASLQE